VKGCCGCCCCCCCRAEQSRAEQSSPALFLSGLTADERCSTWWRVVLLDWIVLYNHPTKKEREREREREINKIIK